MSTFTPSLICKNVKIVLLVQCGGIRCERVKVHPAPILRNLLKRKSRSQEGSRPAGTEEDYSSERVVGGPRHGSWKQPLASGLAGPSLNSDIPIQSWVVFAWKTGINCVKLRPRRCNSCSYFIIYIVAPYITPHS